MMCATMVQGQGKISHDYTTVTTILLDGIILVHYRTFHFIIS